MFEIDENEDLVYEIENGQRVLVRSIESTQRAYLRFTNKTSRPVDIWWRNFYGVKQFYKRLEPAHHYVIATFITHPWEFIDPATKERYMIQNKPIYRPPRVLANVKHVINWNITVGVRTLRHSALLAVALNTYNSDAVNDLGLPQVLAEELQRYIAMIHNPPEPPAPLIPAARPAAPDAPGRP